jgi:hypothetical protein
VPNTGKKFTYKALSDDVGYPSWNGKVVEVIDSSQSGQVHAVQLADVTETNENLVLVIAAYSSELTPVGADSEWTHL